MKRFGSVLLVFVLALTLAVSGCSTTWLTTVDNILVAAAPALINILNIVSIAQGQPLNSSLAAKITADAATVKTLTNDFAAASSAAAPTACAQLQAGIATYSADQQQVLSLANGAVQTKVQVLSSLIAGTVSSILAVIPNCAQAVSMKASLEGKVVPLPLKSFVASYNTNLVVPTGVKEVDKYTKKHKIGGSTKQVLTFGLIK